MIKGEQRVIFMKKGVSEGFKTLIFAWRHYGLLQLWSALGDTGGRALLPSLPIKRLIYQSAQPDNLEKAFTTQFIFEWTSMELFWWFLPWPSLIGWPWLWWHPLRAELRKVNRSASSRLTMLEPLQSKTKCLDEYQSCFKSQESALGAMRGARKRLQ